MTAPKPEDGAAKEPDYDAEHVRWQERIEGAIKSFGLEPFDASGNESGDPLDYTDDQVRMALDAARALGRSEAAAEVEAVRNEAFRAGQVSMRKRCIETALGSNNYQTIADRIAGRGLLPTPTTAKPGDDK